MTLSKWDVKIEKIPIIKVLTHCHTVTDYNTYNIKKNWYTSQKDYASSGSQTLSGTETEVGKYIVATTESGWTNIGLIECVTP